MTEVPLIWRNISTALGAEAREYPRVTGATGIEHQFLSLGVDEVSKRIFLVSADPDPRIAALVQSDVQAAFPEMRILIARPVALDLAYLARVVAGKLGRSAVPVRMIANFAEAANNLPSEERNALVEQIMGAGLEGIREAFRNVTLPVAAQIVTVVQQAAQLDWRTILSSIRNDAQDDPAIPLDGLLNVDNLAIDRQYGVCPIPLYELSSEDWELFRSADDIDAIQARLRELRIFQYFFPSPDELVIGFVDRGLQSLSRVETAIERTNALGHPLSSPSLVRPVEDFRRMIDQMREAGLVVAELEANLEVGPDGARYRASVKSRPQESLLDRVIKRLSVDLTKLTGL